MQEIWVQPAKIRAHQMLSAFYSGFKRSCFKPPSVLFVSFSESSERVVKKDVSCDPWTKTLATDIHGFSRIKSRSQETG